MRCRCAGPCVASLVVAAWACSCDREQDADGPGAGGSGASAGSPSTGGNGGSAIWRGGKRREAVGAAAGAEARVREVRAAAQGSAPSQRPRAPRHRPCSARSSVARRRGLPSVASPRACSARPRGGEVVTLGDEAGTASCAMVRSCVPSDAPTLLFSDEPEYVGQDGVLYADQVGAGRYRVYVYHVNAVEARAGASASSRSTRATVRLR